MPKRLPGELRVLYDVACGVAAPRSHDEVVARLSDELRRAFGFAEVRFVSDDAGRDELVLLDAALEERRAVADRARVAIPLLAERACVGYLIADRAAAPPAPGGRDSALVPR